MARNGLGETSVVLLFSSRENIYRNYMEGVAWSGVKVEAALEYNKWLMLGIKSIHNVPIVL